MRMFRTKPRRIGRMVRSAGSIAFERLEERLAPAVFHEVADLANNFFATAQAVDLEVIQSNGQIVGGTTVISGTIATHADVDFYRFTAPTNLPHAVVVSAELAATGVEGTLDSVLSVYDAAQNLITSNDDSIGPGGAPSVDSRLTFAVEPGQTYFVQAAAFFPTHGGYLLTLIVPPTVDDAGNDAANAQQIAVPPGGVSLSGSIELSGDVDVFAFTAPADGILRVAQSAAHNSSLDSLLGVRDANGVVLVQNDDANKLGTRDSAIQLPVTAGTQYFIHAGGFDGISTGAYHLSVLIDTAVGDDFADSFAGATTIAVDGQGMGSRAGRLELLGDGDMFRFTAPVTGQFVIGQRAYPSSTLDSYLRVFDAAGTLIAENDDVLFGVDLNSQVTFSAVAGSEYFIEAGSFQGQTGQTDQGIGVGEYVVSVRPQTVAPDSFGDTLAAATTIALTAGTNVATGQQSGVIDIAGDVDVFRFVAPSDGTVLLAQTAGPDNTLDSVLVVLDAAGNVIALNDNSGTLDSFVKFHVDAGQTVFVRAEGAAGSVGTYDLSLRLFDGGLAVTDLNHGISPETMVVELLGGGNATTVSLPGGAVAALEHNGLVVLTDSIGFFGAGTAGGVFADGDGILNSRNLQSPFDRGIVLSTGSVVDVIGPNYRDDTSTQNFATANHLRLDPANPLHHQILQAIAGIEGADTFDGAALFFEFIPDASVGVVEFDFVFGSEEYNEFVLSGFNDVFGFFVNGRNYARLGANTHAADSGDLVSIDTVNLDSHAEEYLNNSLFPTAPFGIVNIELDGLTTVLTVRAPVNVGAVNTIIIGLTDVGDGLYDSAVFLSGGSFRTGAESIQNTGNAAVAQQLVSRLTTFVANSNAAPTDVAFHHLLQQLLVHEALKGFDLTSGFLVIPVDPVDFTLAAPNGAEFDGSGQIPNIPNAFFASTNNGANDFLIIAHPQPGQYQLELAGTGSGDFRWGASYVSPFGAVTSVLVQGRLQPGLGTATLDFNIGAGLGDPRFLAGTLAQARTGRVDDTTHFVTLNPGELLDAGAVGIALAAEGFGRVQNVLSSVFASGVTLAGTSAQGMSNEGGAAAAERDLRNRDVAGDSGIAGPGGSDSGLPDVLDAVLQSTRRSVADMIDATFETFGLESDPAMDVPWNDVLMPLFDAYWPGMSLPPEILHQLQKLPKPKETPAPAPQRSAQPKAETPDSVIPAADTQSNASAAEEPATEESATSAN